MAPFSAPFAKLQWRLLVTSFLSYCKIREEDGKKTCRKNFAFFKQGECCCWKFVSELQSCFPPKTLLFDPVDDCHDTITDGLKIYRKYIQWCQVREDIPCVQGNLQVYSLPHWTAHWTQFATSPCFTSGITSGSIQCTYSVLETSPRGPLVTPHANAIPPKYTYEFCLALQRHDVWIAAVPESCSTIELVELNCFSWPNLIQKFNSDAVLLPGVVLSNLIPELI